MKTVLRPVSFRGDRWTLETFDPDAIGGSIRKHGVPYENAILEVLADLFAKFPPGGTCLDVGANVGNHAVAFSRMGFDRLVAVEMMPETHAVLSRNLARESAIPFETVNAAVTSGDTAGLAVYELPGNAGSASLRQPAEVWKGQRHVPADVRFVTLDSLDVRDVTFLKLDVEGHEVRALAGADSILAQHPLVMVEAFESHFRDVRAAFSAHGYDTSLVAQLPGSNWLFDHRPDRLLAAYRLIRGGTGG